MSDSPQSSMPSDVTEDGPQVNVSKAQSCYVNFCRVTGTPEEMILDFALNSDVSTAPETHVVADQRIALGYFTAKRLLHVLELTLQRHEKAFGFIETSIERRAGLLPPKGDRS